MEKCFCEADGLRHLCRVDVEAQGVECFAHLPGETACVTCGRAEAAHGRSSDPIFAAAAPSTVQRLTQAETWRTRSASDQIAHLLQIGWPRMRVWVAAGRLLPDVRR